MGLTVGGALRGWVKKGAGRGLPRQDAWLQVWMCRLGRVPSGRGWGQEQGCWILLHLTLHPN